MYYNTKSMEVNMIKTARKYKKMTLMDVSSATGISKGTLSRIESGKIDVRLSTLNRICRAIGVKIVISL